MKKIFTPILTLITLLLCLSSFSCSKTNTITVPLPKDVISVTVNYGDGEYTCNEISWIQQLISIIEKSTSTNRPSVADYPMAENYITITIQQSKGASRLFVYQEDHIIYIEQPYQGIFKSEVELYELITEKTC